MTKEITKAYILQQIQDKFKLRDLDPEIFRFSEEVIPTYNIEPHLVTGEVQYTEISITAGPAGYLFFTVPQKEKWTIQRYNVIFMAAGAYKVTGAYVRRISTVDHIYTDMTLGQTASYCVNLPQPLNMGPGDRLHLYVDDYTSTANLRLYIDVMKEEIR